MLQISCGALSVAITLLWLITRIALRLRRGCFHWRREAQLLLIYVCYMVVVRFTFFPFGKIDGQIQPLIFDAATAFPPRINLQPIVHLFDYPDMRDALLNLIGNTAMFLPVGMIYPTVFRSLDTPAKAIAAGAGLSLAIELLQLPFTDRVTDIDDLLLNTVGYILGYLLYTLVRRIRRRA